MRRSRRQTDNRIKRIKMAKKSIINRILQNTRKPEGFFGRMILRGMNWGHARMARWGMSHIDFLPRWHILDIGCGGGANMAEMLRRSPQGMVYGIDFSPESVAFARRKNAGELGRRCFVTEGTADSLPFGEETFDLVTAFETVYFWEDLPRAFAEAARVLKSGGMVLVCNEVCDPDDTTWTDRIEGMRIYSAETIAKRLTEAGFRDAAIFRHKGEAVCVTARKA